MFAIISYRYPFTKRDYKVLYRQQLKRSWMSKRVYTCFSIEAFDLIKCMLEPMPKKRYTAKEIMQHKWIKSYRDKDLKYEVQLKNSDLNQNKTDKKKSKLTELKDLNEQIKKLTLDDTTSDSSSESYSIISDESVKTNEPISQSILSTKTGLESENCIEH